MNTVFTTLYTIIVTLWVTIFIERWKRKSAEICHKWGISDILLQSQGESRVMRDDFKGYEYLSLVTRNTQKKNSQFKLSMLMAVLSILAQGGLIVASIFTYIG